MRNLQVSIVTTIKGKIVLEEENIQKTTEQETT
jgi:hypothetical protein